MEKIYNVGKDVPYDLPTEDGLEWLVFAYEDYDGYSGGGQAVALKTDGMVLVRDLGHCSCYGPFDCWETSSQKITVEELLRAKDSVHDMHIDPDIMSKVMELLG